MTDTTSTPSSFTEDTPAAHERHDLTKQDMAVLRSAQLDHIIAINTDDYYLHNRVNYSRPGKRKIAAAAKDETVSLLPPSYHSKTLSEHEWALAAAPPSPVLPEVTAFEDSVQWLICSQKNGDALKWGLDGQAAGVTMRAPQWRFSHGGSVSIAMHYEKDDPELAVPARMQEQAYAHFMQMTPPTDSEQERAYVAAGTAAAMRIGSYKALLDTLRNHLPVAGDSHVLLQATAEKLAALEHALTNKIATDQDTPDSTHPLTQGDIAQAIAKTQAVYQPILRQHYTHTSRGL